VDDLGAGEVAVQGFCAMMADSADMMRARLCSRYGPELLERVEIIEG